MDNNNGKIDLVDPEDQVFCPLRSGAIAANHSLKGQVLLTVSGICLLSEGKQCAFAPAGECLIKKFLELPLSDEEEKNSNANE